MITRMRRRHIRLLLTCVVALGLVATTWHVRDTLLPGSKQDEHVVGERRSARTALPREFKTPTGAGVESLARDRAKALKNLADQAEELNRFALDPPVAEFVLATYNVLGSSHTGRGGRRGYAGGVPRLLRALDKIRGHGIDVIGLQELQPNQRDAFRAYGTEFDIYTPPGGRFRDDSVAWRRDRFELVAGGSVSYPYFGGRLRPYPQVLLREKRTGVRFFVTSYHNPAYEGGTRARAVRMQIDNANALITRTKRPMLITGDMNDRRTYVCPMVTSTPMRPAQGGGCDADSRAVDWLMGSSPNVVFSGFLLDWTTEHARLSDHPLVVATARVTGLPEDRREAEDPWSKAPKAG